MNLRTQVLSGLFWVGSARVIGQIVNWAITLVVIRLLSPADYGLLAMAMVFVSFITLFSEAGLGAALVQAPQLDEGKLRSIFGAVILVDLALFALQVLAAPAIALFFEEERLTWIIRVLALHLLFSMFAVIPGALLTRRLEFKSQSLLGVAGSVVGALTTLVLALRGDGVAALVFGSLATHLFNAIAINIVNPFLLSPDFSLRGIRAMVVFGSQLTGSVILRFVYSQADIFIAGKLLGKELLGLYSVALHLASLPVQRISAVVNQVSYPAFARAQDQPGAIPFYMLKGIRLLSFFSLPVLWGISSTAGEIVTVVLGPKWEAAILPLQLLPLAMPITMLSPFLNSAFLGIGKGGVVFMNVLTAALIMPAAFLVGVNWELLGLSLAWLICFPLVFLLNLWRMLPLIGLKLRHVLGAAALPTLAAAGMYGCVEIVRNLAAGSLSSPVLLGALVATGAAAYAGLTLALNAKGAREVLDLFRKRPPDVPAV